MRSKDVEIPVTVQIDRLRFEGRALFRAGHFQVRLNPDQASAASMADFISINQEVWTRLAEGQTVDVPFAGGTYATIRPLPPWSSDPSTQGVLFDEMAWKPDERPLPGLRLDEDEADQDQRAPDRRDP